MNILHLKNVPILEQLLLEEALLRTDTRNVCIINEGSTPAIVMGISGKVEELINLDKHTENPIPIIKRYSGGGTVVVDSSTIFVSFICNKDLVDFEAFPEPLMRWSANIYKEALPQIPFDLRENDYVIGSKKVGGNAQYLTKTRFVHHTTFLWNYEESLMDLLKLPKKAPSYRSGRDHQSFVSRLEDHFPNREAFVSQIKQYLLKSFGGNLVKPADFESTATSTHRRSTSLVPISMLETSFPLTP